MTQSTTTSDTKNSKESSPYSSLSGSFSAAELEARDRFYDIKEEDSLIEKLKSMLRESANGARLLDLAESQGVEIKLIKSRKLQSATTPDLQVFLAAEDGQAEPYMTQVLEFGGALREIEQTLMGYKISETETDPLEKANMAHTKYLDKIIYMCKIGIDLEIMYSDKVKEAISAFGFEDFYRAQIESAEDEVIQNIYLDIQNSVVDSDEN